MSGVQNANAWVKCREESALTPYYNGTKQCGYTIGKNEVGFLLTSYHLLANAWKNSLKANQGDAFSCPRSEAQDLLRAITDTFVAHIGKRTLDIPHISTFAKNSWKSLQVCRLSDTEMKAAIAQSFDLTQALIAELPEVISAESLQSFYQAMGTRMQQLVVEKGYVLIDQHICLTEPERQFFSLAKSDPQPDLYSLDCVGYAFLKLREPHAKSWILQCKPDPIFFKYPLQTLQAWGYQVVLEPQANDLVLYFNDADRQFKLMHGALYQDSGTLLMKLGPYEGIYQCYIHQVRAIYGNIVMFFRKSP